MKIAILTQPLGLNYGGIMQAWALQQVLKRMGHEPVTIDRQSDAKGIPYRFARLLYRAAMKSIGQRSGPIHPERFMPLVTTNTRRFIREHIVMSEQLDASEKLAQHFRSNIYDAVVVGSDQTWRPEYSPNIYNFFLDFLPDQNLRKIAYASSFGVDHWEFNDKQTRICAALAQKFNFITVREESAITLCRNHLNVTAALALDPTLLLDQNDYLGLLKEGERQNLQGGLYAYFLDKTDTKERIANYAAKELNTHVFAPNARRNLADTPVSAIEECVIPPVEDWICGFATAKFVITDSFHGMVFSIIFGKPFLIISNKNRGAARFTSLLDQLGLSGRLLDDPSPETVSTFITHRENIEYSDRLNDLRAISISMLQRTLQ